MYKRYFIICTRNEIQAQVKILITERLKRRPKTKVVIKWKSDEKKDSGGGGE
jgi:hypothetical protein